MPTRYSEPLNKNAPQLGPLLLALQPIEWRLRRMDPSVCYDESQFSVATCHNGDTHDIARTIPCYPQL
jgi:NADH:ubiquinone oxidoreductase subunit D